MRVALAFAASAAAFAAVLVVGLPERCFAVAKLVRVALGLAAAERYPSDCPLAARHRDQGLYPSSPASSAEAAAAGLVAVVASAASAADYRFAAFVASSVAFAASFAAAAGFADRLAAVVAASAAFVASSAEAAASFGPDFAAPAASVPSFAEAVVTDHLAAVAAALVGLADRFAAALAAPAFVVAFVVSAPDR